jgi:protease I
MSTKLRGKKVAFLATDGFEQVELTEPKRILEEAGAAVSVVSPKEGQIKGWDFTDWGHTVRVDKTLGQTKAADYDALVLPGGVINPDALRLDPKAVAFVKEFAAAGKPIASICHGPWMLVEAGLVKGKKVTSWPSLKTDIANAGGHWSDEQVVTDGLITTSRKPEDIPAFAERIIREVGASHMKAAS